METTNQLFEAIDNGEILADATKQRVILETLCDDHGANDWEDFIRMTNHLGVYYLAEWLGKATNIVDLGGGKVRYTFIKPIKMITGFRIVSGEREDVVSEVSEMTFEIKYDYSYRQRPYGHANDYPCMIDIYGRAIDVK